MKKRVAIVAKNGQDAELFGFPVTFFCSDGNKVWVRKDGNGVSVTCNFNAIISVEDDSEIKIENAGGLWK